MRCRIAVGIFLSSVAFSLHATAETLGFSTVSLASDRVVIAPDASYGKFMDAAAAREAKVWFTDQYRQPWVRARPRLSGHRNALLVRVRERANPDGRSPCKVEVGPKGYVEQIENCSMPIAGFEFFPRTVIETPMVRWLCDGSWLPALYLGDAPEGNNGYEGMWMFAVVSEHELPVPTVKRITPTIPPSIEKQFAQGYDAWSFDFGDGVERWLIYFSDFMAGPYYWLIEDPRDDRARRVRQASSIYGRC